MSKDQGDQTKMIGVIIANKFVDHIDAWADRLRHSRSKMARIILEAAIEDDGWMWRLLTSRPSMSLLKLFGKDFQKPLDDEDERAVRKMITQASPLGCVKIIELCQAELANREKDAA